MHKKRKKKKRKKRKRKRKRQQQNLEKGNNPSMNMQYHSRDIILKQVKAEQFRGREIGKRENERQPREKSQEASCD